MRKTYLLVMAAILLAAGLAVTAVLSTGSIASANDPGAAVFLPADPSPLPETGGTPLDADPPAFSESSELSEGVSESPSSEELPSEGTSSAPLQPSSVLSSSSLESSDAQSNTPSSGSASSSASDSQPSGPPPVDSSFDTSESSVPSSAPSSAPSSEPSSEPSSSSAPSAGETLRVSLNGHTTEGDAYSILCQIVEAETGGSFHTEALKAQAVAAHSYIRFENAAGRTPSLPGRTPTRKTMDAVSAVLDKLLYYNGSVAFTPYHASSAGITNSSSEIWGGSYPYLTNVTSAYDPSAAYKNQQVTLSASTVQAKLESYLKITLPSDPASWFADYTTNSGGYVTRIQIPDSSGNTHTVTGRQVRENILGYAIRSHAFTVTVSEDALIFTTNGYGHGVGMSQTGANAYAVNDGWTYSQILSHYYPGTVLS